MVIITGSLWYTNILVREIAQDERRNIRIWADAIHHKADLVNYTDSFFVRLENEERKRMELLAEAYKSIALETTSDALNFYLKMIRSNTNIPVILTDGSGNITNAVNVDFDKDTMRVLRGKLLEEFTTYPPIQVKYLMNRSIFLYYKDSRLFTELRNVLDDLIDSFFQEVVLNSASVPVIITDSTRRRVLEHGMIDPRKAGDSTYMMHILSRMESQNEPIEIELAGQGKRFIFYKDSDMLTRMIYFPYFQLAVIGIFLLISYILFSSARKSEQNQVWVGLAKETAHQLGTPLSSILAWIELLGSEHAGNEAFQELAKDVERLQKITDRFSKIGSEPKLKPENIVRVVYDGVAYIRTRSSERVEYHINVPPDARIMVPLNLHLFEWVIENLCKNAIDAMGNYGLIDIHLIEESGQVIIDFSDTGKGIPKSLFKTIFNPGYTSKKRGWGLGLSLADRIIRNYHNGRIFVKSSVLGKGTTFRIILRK